MSFILDALKKSENERQRHQGPSLVDVPTRRAPSERPLWVLVLAALLALNLVVFVIVLLRKHDEPVTPSPAAADASQPVPTTVTPPPPRVAAAPASLADPAPATTRDPAVRSLAEEAGVAEGEDMGAGLDPALAGAADVPAGPPIVSPIQGPTAAPARTPLPTVRTQDNLPTINDVTANGATQLPEMHLDIHVYATAPAERFVFINMKKYVEGDTTAEGVTVEQIRRDGVVLNHQGIRLLLPRQ